MAHCLVRGASGLFNIGVPWRVQEVGPTPEPCGALRSLAETPASHCYLNPMVPIFMLEDITLFPAL